MLNLVFACTALDDNEGSCPISSDKGATVAPNAKTPPSVCALLRPKRKQLTSRVLFRGKDGDLEEVGSLEHTCRRIGDLIKVGNRRLESFLHVTHKESRLA